MITFQSVVGGGEDETGLVSFALRYHASTIEEAFNAGERFYLGLKMRDRRISPKTQDDKSGGFFVDLAYYGVLDGKEPNQVETNFEGEFSKAPLETYPKFSVLKERFGAYLDEGNNVRFPPNLYRRPGASGAGGFAVQPSSDADDKSRNPMYGRTDWPLFHSVFTRSYTRRKVPGDILRKVGTVTKSPPDFDPSLTPNGRDWLFLAPLIRGNSKAATITERYKLSPPGGWPPHIHMLYQSGLSG